MGSGGRGVNCIKEKYEKFKYHSFLARQVSDPVAEDFNTIQQCYKYFN